MEEHARDDDPSRWSSLPRRDRAAALVVPLLLVLVASLSTYRYHDLRQSSWQGVSFGMFATYDNRVSRFTVVEADGTIVDASTAFADLVDRGEVTPLGPAPAELAERVRDRTGADDVLVEVWTVHVFAGTASLRVELELVRTVTSP